MAIDFGSRMPQQIEVGPVENVYRVSALVCLGFFAIDFPWVKADSSLIIVIPTDTEMLKERADGS